jgi:hypothetical protein
MGEFTARPTIVRMIATACVLLAAGALNVSSAFAGATLDKVRSTGNEGSMAGAANPSC